MNKLLQPKTRFAPASIEEFVSFVVPVYNEEQVLPEFYEEFVCFLKSNRFSNYEIVFVNDGSSDDSLNILQSLSSADPHLKIVNLARNFGKEIALTAGLDFTAGDAVVPIDADLQHPFPVILEFVENWRKGYDMVYAVQANRQQSCVRKFFSKIFYRLFSKMTSQQSLPENAGDFRLLTRRAVNKLTKMRERHRIMKGLYSIVGLKQTAVYFTANERRAGTTNWSFWNLLNLAMEAITSFSTAPLRIATAFGICSAFLSLVYAFVTIVKTLVYGDPVAGYPTLITVTLFLGSAQLICLGIIGEYLGRVFNETKNRPLYFVEDIYQVGEAIGDQECR